MTPRKIEGSRLPESLLRGVDYVLDWQSAPGYSTTIIRRPAMTREAVIAEARQWIGTSWAHQACVKGAGVDCLHLIAGIARAFGRPEAERFFATSEYHSYGRHPDPAMMFGGCDALLDRIAIADALPADVLVLRCGKHPMHFGLLTAADMMVHAWLGAGRVIEQRIDAKWRSRIIRAYRLRGIA